jgi:hypothetical protein
VINKSYIFTNMLSRSWGEDGRLVQWKERNGYVQITMEKILTTLRGSLGVMVSIIFCLRNLYYKENMKVLLVIELCIVLFNK